jgi:hypothetical protein
MFLAQFSTDFVQDVYHGFPSPTHNSLWLKGLGALFTWGKLGFSRENADPSPSTHHQMQANSTPTHHSCKVWWFLPVSLLHYIRSFTQWRVGIGTRSWLIAHRNPLPYLFFMVILGVGLQGSHAFWNILVFQWINFLHSYTPWCTWPPLTF